MQNVAIDPYTIAFIILTTFITAGYILYIIRKKEGLNLIPLLATILTVILLYRLIGVIGSTNYWNLFALDMCIAILSTILAVFYISKPYVFVGLAAMLIAGMVIYAINYAGSTIFAGMFAIGTIYGLLYREFVLNPKKSTKASSDRKDKKVEVKRDYVHIVLGIILVAVLYFVPYPSSVAVIFLLIVLGYTFNNLLANLRLSYIYRKASDFERKNVTYGLGAIYLASSTALVLGFTHNISLLLFGVIVLFFADPLATIIGISRKRPSPLPYNRYKTIAGTLTFLVVSLIAGYYLLSWYGILFALVLTFIESLNLSIDDNIRSGVVIVILGALLGL